MGITWLQYFTNVGNTDRLRAVNERKAAAVHARWRAMLGWLAELAARSDGRWTTGRRERAERRELDALSDHILRDIGLRRSASGTVLVDTSSSRDLTALPRPARGGAIVSLRTPVAMLAEDRASRDYSSATMGRAA